MAYTIKRSGTDIDIFHNGVKVADLDISKVDMRRGETRKEEALWFNESPWLNYCGQSFKLPIDVLRGTDAEITHWCNDCLTKIKWFYDNVKN